MVVLTRRRVAALLVLLAVTVGVVVLALSLVSHPDTPKVPEGGSSFGAGRKVASQSLLDGLAPLLAAGTPTPVGTTAAQGKKAPARTGQTQRLAQLFLVGFRGRETGDPFFARLVLRRWGAVIVDAANYRDKAQLIALTTQTVQVMRNAGLPPPLIAVRQGGGTDNTLRGLPPAAPNTIGSASEARAVAARTAAKLHRLGIRLNLAPSADVGYAGGAWDGRAFSDDPDIVKRRAAAAVRGWRAGGVAPAPGHFPGEGAASQDPADGPATVGLGSSELQVADLHAFDGLLRAAPALVLSNALYAAFDGVTPATLLPQVPALARRSGFKGVIVSGNLAETVLASGGSIADAAVDALKAGCDLLWIPGDAGDQEAAYRAVVRAVRRREIPQSRVRSALAHVAALKRKYAAR